MSKPKEIGVLAEILKQDASFALATNDTETLVLEDSKLWRMVYDRSVFLIDLFHYNSSTRSVVMIGEDGQMIEKTFDFIPRESGPQDDDGVWLQQHKEKLGLT